MSAHKTAKMRIGRRDFGRLGAAGLLAGVLPISGVQAQSNVRKKRLLTIMTPLGHANDWQPTVGADGLQFPAQSAALQPLRDKLLVTNSLRTALVGPDRFEGTHEIGSQATFTGAGWRLSKQGEPVVRANTTKPSIDQLVATDWGRTPLVLGALSTKDPQARISWRERPGQTSQGVAPQINARVAFDSLFSDFGATEQELVRIRARRGSVLDLWTAEINQLFGRVSAQSRPILDSHLEQIRLVERQLDQSASALDTCDPVGPGSGDGFYSTVSNYPQIIRQMSDLIVTAFACDRVDIATLSFDRTQSKLVHRWLGIGSDHHYYTHNKGEGDNKSALYKIYTWQTEQVAYLLSALDAIQTPEGHSLLDETVVYWGSEGGVDTSHNGHDSTTVVCAAGHMRTNTLVSPPGEKADQVQQNDLLAEVYTACTGKQTMVFDDPGNGTRNEMPEVRA